MHLSLDLMLCSRAMLCNVASSALTCLADPGLRRLLAALSVRMGDGFPESEFFLRAYRSRFAANLLAAGERLDDTAAALHVEDEEYGMVWREWFEEQQRAVAARRLAQDDEDEPSLDAEAWSRDPDEVRDSRRYQIRTERSAAEACEPE